MMSLRRMVLVIAAILPSSAALASSWGVYEPAYPVWSAPPRAIVVVRQVRPVYAPAPAFLYPYPLYRPVIYNHPPRFELYTLDVVHRPRILRRRIHRRVIARVVRKCCCGGQTHRRAR